MSKDHIIRKAFFFLLLGEGCSSSGDRWPAFLTPDILSSHLLLLPEAAQLEGKTLLGVACQVYFRVVIRHDRFFLFDTGLSWRIKNKAKACFVQEKPALLFEKPASAFLSGVLLYVSVLSAATECLSGLGR